MDTLEVREIERRYNLWGSFKDELVATAMTLSLVVLGSFLFTERMVVREKTLLSNASVSETENIPQTLGVIDEAPIPSPTISSLSQTTIASEGAVVFSEVPYGESGDYDFPEYSIRFYNPRIVFDAATNSRRRFVVSVWIKNKIVVEGIESKLSVSIIKDGVVIVPNAAMHIPLSRLIPVNDEGTFEASISLIEGTDVRELKYNPNVNLPIASHFLP